MVISGGRITETGLLNLRVSRRVGGGAVGVSYPRMTELFDLSGRTALVTGGSKGLGKCMARTFAEAGASIFICSRSEDELKAAAAAIGEGLTVQVEYMTADLTDRTQTQKLAREALSRLGRVDILVNNAGSNIPQAIDEITDEAWDRILELNLSSAVRLTRRLLRK